jgi:hypothetical protein
MHDIGFLYKGVSKDRVLRGECVPKIEEVKEVSIMKSFIICTHQQSSEWSNQGVRDWWHM